MQSYTWIYSLTDEISSEKVATLRNDFDQFTQEWKSHGTPVDGLIRIFYNRFVVIQSDPGVNRPSGCSIDSLKKAIGQILTQHELKWLDAAYVFFRNSEGNIQHTHFQQIPTKVASGDLLASTTVFDHSLSQSDDMSKWEVPMEDTWLRRYLAVKN